MEGWQGLLRLVSSHGAFKEEEPTNLCKPCEPCEPLNHPPPPRSCWVCAAQEPFVSEPSLYRKTAHLLQDHGPIPVLVGVGSCLVLPLLLAALSSDLLPAVDATDVSRATASMVEAAPTGVLSFWALLPALGLALLASFAWNTVMLPDMQSVSGTKLEPPAPCDAGQLSRLGTLLSGAIRIQTVSHDKDDPDGRKTDVSTFIEMHRYLERAFPLVHTHLKRTVVNEFSLLYEWPGTEPDEPAVMFCAHMDVVPAPDNEPTNRWSQPPFEGHIDAEGVVWGRGAIDNKHNLIAQLAAVEAQLQRGVTRQRTVYFAFGHDEEIGGEEGARAIAAELSTRLGGRQLAFVLDEGAFVIRGALPGMQPPIAFIANSEKGAVNVRLRVNVSLTMHDPSHRAAPHATASGAGRP